MHELSHEFKSFSDKEKIVVLLMDEMKSKICNMHNGKLIGYVYLGTIKLNCAILWKVTKVESHVLIFQLFKCFCFYGKPLLYVKKVY